MKFNAKLTGVLLILISALGYSESLQAEKLNIKYSKIYGWLSILLESNEEIDRRCNTSLTSMVFMNEFDYLLRTKTSYSYFDWSTKIANEKYQKERVVESVDNILSNIGGCNVRTLKLIDRHASNRVKKLILDLRALDALKSLQQISRSERYIIEKYSAKIKNYQNLPEDEIRDLINSLETGKYSYAMFGPMISTGVDNNKAASLRKYLTRSKER